MLGSSTKQQIRKFGDKMGGHGWVTKCT